MAGALAPFSYLWAERAPANARPQTHARERAPASPFTLRLFAVVACKITVVGGRRFTGPYQLPGDTLPFMATRALHDRSRKCHLKRRRFSICCPPEPELQ